MFLFKTEFIVIGTCKQFAKVNIASICVGGDANTAQVTSVTNHGSWFDHVKAKKAQLTVLEKSCNRGCFFNNRKTRELFSNNMLQNELEGEVAPVSYTHLTLPTKRIV